MIMRCLLLQGDDIVHVVGQHKEVDRKEKLCWMSHENKRQNILEIHCVQPSLERRHR